MGPRRRRVTGTVRACAYCSTLEEPACGHRVCAPPRPEEYVLRAARRQCVPRIPCWNASSEHRLPASGLVTNRNFIMGRIQGGARGVSRAYMIV